MAKDLIHYSVKEALENEGWTVTDDPLTIDLTEDDTFFDIDLAAERRPSRSKVNESWPLK